MLSHMMAWKVDKNPSMKSGSVAAFVYSSKRSLQVPSSGPET